MRKFGSRIKAKVKEFLESDEAPTRPSTPTPVNSPGNVITPVVDQTPAYYVPNQAEGSTTIHISSPTPGPEAPMISTSEPRLNPDLALAIQLNHTRPPTPNPHSDAVIPPPAQQTPSLSSPEPVPAQGTPAFSSATAILEDAVPHPVEQPSVDPPSAPKRITSSSGSDTWAWIKSEGWANLKALLDSLAEAASVSGLGPVKEVVEGLASCVGIYKDAAEDRKEYDELRVQLEGIFGDLKPYFSSSPAITTSVASICGSIQKEIDYLKTQQAIPTTGRLAKAETNGDVILECYRRIQDHLQRLSRNANMSIWRIVDELATEHRLEKLAPSMWPCYNSEKAAGIGRRACTEGTRTNVLAHLHDWVSGRNTGNVYWINGMAGTGKTTIAYSLCQQLAGRGDRLLSASFFCSRSLPECRDVGRIIPSIAYQLARTSKPFRYALSQATEKDPDAHTRSPDLQFDGLIVGPLSDERVREAMPAKMVVVIDALDECEDTKSTEQILDVLLTKSKGLPVKFVVSSRPEAVIRDRMGKKDGYDSRVVLHELDSGEVKTDIKTYLKAELATMNPSVAEIDRLVERAGVLFIYAATVVRYVGHDGFRRKPRQRLKTVLDTSRQQGGVQTQAIDELYGAILRAANDDDQLEQEDRDDMKLILNTVICAKAPLTVDALNGLLNLGDVDRVDAALRPLWSVLHVMQPKKTVTTLHASFPDYLTDPKRSSSDWHCDPAAHNRVLAERCFEYIRHTKPQFNICRLPSSFLYDHEVEDMDSRVQEFISTELRYACQYWSAHLDGSDAAGAPTLMTLLNYFLTTNLLLWVEVMNLTKNISATPANLSIAKLWAMPHNPSRELGDLIHDAMRFTTTFISGSVSQSTPHIYISMIPFLSSHSPIRKHYMPGMQLPGVHGTALDRRKPLLAKWQVKRSGSVACSADGTLLAIGSWDVGDCISLVHTSSGRSVRDIFHDHVSDVRCIAFSPDGSRIACGTKKGTIWVWDVSSGHPLLGPLQGPQNRVISIIFSHDGSRIISVSYDNTIRIWESRSGECLLDPLIGHTDSVKCLAVSSGDSMLISGSWDKTVRVWDMQTGRSLFNPITGHTDVVRSVAISPDGQWIVSGSDDGTVRVWNTRAGQMLLGPLQTQNGRPFSVAISPDGAFFSAGFDNGTIQIWDATTGQAVSSPFKEHSSSVMILKYSTDGTRMLSYSMDGSLCVFDAQTAATAMDLPPGHTMSVLSIDVSPDGKRIVSGSSDTTVCVWDPVTGELVLGPLTGHTEHVHFVRYSPDGNRILSCSSDRNLYQWDAQTGAIYQVDSPIVDPFISRYGELGFVSATYSPDGNSIAAISKGDDIYIWDSSSGNVNLGPIKADKEGKAIEFSLDGTTLITGWRNGAVDIWDVHTGQLVSSHQPQDHFYVLALAFSPNLDRYTVAYFGSGGASLHQRSTQTGERITGLLRGHTDYIQTVQYSSDSRHIVSGFEDKTVQIWDAQTGDSVFGPLKGHTGRIHSVACSPDSTYVASASYDMTIRIWDTRLTNHTSEAHETPGMVEWVLDEDGWVVDEQSQRLIWVPPDLRSSLMWPRNTMVISRNGYARLDFGGAPIGKEWAGCWSGC